MAIRFIMPAAWSRSHFIPGRFRRKVSVLPLAKE
jgi:hypothetical protein